MIATRGRPCSTIETGLTTTLIAALLAAVSLGGIGPATAHAAASSAVSSEGVETEAACGIGSAYFEAGLSTGNDEEDESWSDVDNSVIAKKPEAFHWRKGIPDANQFRQLWSASCWNGRVPDYLIVDLVLLYNDLPQPGPPFGRTSHTVRVTLSPLRGQPPSNPPFLYGGPLVVRRDGRRIPRKELIAYTLTSVFIQYKWTWADLPFFVGEQRYINNIHRNWNIVAQDTPDPPPKDGEEVPIPQRPPQP